MALKLLTKTEENQIVRNIGLAITKDINLLNKNGYEFLHVCSGFIAHYNLHGFISHYGCSSHLAMDIITNYSGNQYSNWFKGETDYEYYMQKKRIYKRIYGIAKGDERFKIPSLENSTVHYPKIKEQFNVSNEEYKNIRNAFASHLYSGMYFNLSDLQRANDLADAALAYRELSNFSNYDSILNTEFEFEFGNIGTIVRLLNVYHDSIWGIFNEYSNREMYLEY